MIYQGEAVTVRQRDDAIAQLHFDLAGASVNKFDSQVIAELNEALNALEAEQSIKGLLVTSGKSVFIAGADIEQLAELGKTTPEQVKAFIQRNNSNFSRIARLPFPSVVAINGYALGGGFEFCLACDGRVMSSTAVVGLPETQIGVIPGWAGTVRLPRLIGVDKAADWIATGSHKKARQALDDGAVDVVAEPDNLEAASMALLRQYMEGSVDYLARRKIKQSPLALNSTEIVAVFTAAKQLAKKVGGHNPAPLIAVEAMETAAAMDGDKALEVETQRFCELVVSDSAAAMLGTFLSDQLLAKKARALAKQARRPVARGAVLGAGIMGGGISYQSALKGVPVLMKDINQNGLDLGVKEAASLLDKRVKRGSISEQQKQTILDRIKPTLTYEGFANVDLVVEAVVENPKVKHAVLAEVEREVAADTVITSNTSTISITYLAEALQRPENFCGMHFFNPVHAMPLVEVIRGKKSSDEAIARTVAYASEMGKKPIVVNDCPGFLVNRSLFPYYAGFAGLIRDGADFVEIDRVMTQWGWPMGPALLADVIGIDTMVHCESVMAEGFPDRMAKPEPQVMDFLFTAGRLGQKNAKGFYDHGKDENGRMVKTASREVYQLIEGHAAPRREFSEQEIIARMMVPMATELARILDEAVVETPAEADLGLLYGLGFPAFRGGVLRWLDAIGMGAFCEMADNYQSLGRIYQPTDSMREMARKNETYYY